MIPGFVTDVLGIFLVLPVTRPLARRLVARRLRGHVRVIGGLPGRRPSYDSDVIEGEVVDERLDEGPADRPGHESGPRSLGG